MLKRVPDGPAEGEISHDDIARCAYELWESQGRPEGCSMQHWFEAEAQLRALMSQRESAARVEASSTRGRTRKGATRRGSDQGEKRFEVIT